ncbi:MAG: hypothetical protein J6S26_05825 [Solobacterium sp.]|nr:hypothetical protein [Solobacterium sp.]
MNFVKSTTLSTRRIVISVLIYLMVPVLRFLLARLTGNDTLSFMFALNLCACLLLIYDWELFGLHWNRMKSNTTDTLLYVLVGTVFLFFWTLVNSNYLQGYMILPDPQVFRNYPIATPAVLFAFGVSLPVIVNMEFKVMTDHFKVHAREASMIVMSGFLFGLLLTITLTPLRFDVILQTYIYHIVLISVLAYLYNQTHSFISGMISMSIVYLSWQILFLM